MGKKEKISESSFSFVEYKIHKSTLTLSNTEISRKMHFETLGKTVYNFSWNLDCTIWEGKNVEAQIMESGNAMGVVPDDPIADSERGNSEDHAPFLSPDSLFANLAIGAIDGRVNIIGEDGQAKPLEITGVPAKVKKAISEGDYYKAYTLMLAEGIR